MKARELPASLYHSLRLRFGSWGQPRGEVLPLRVTLTVIPSRLHALDIVLKSLLAQTTPPERILVWLHEGMRGTLPRRVRTLIGDTVRVDYVPGTSSHNKLVHAVAAEPDAVFVTCDDDMIYPAEWLERLWRDHLEHPEAVVANDVRMIRTDGDYRPRPYAAWRLAAAEERLTAPAFMGVGWAGVLYPPRCFHPDVTDASRYLELTPRADDLWFKAMSHLAGTPVYRARHTGTAPIPIGLTQRVSLKGANVSEDRNRVQWEAVADAYGIRFDER